MRNLFEETVFKVIKNCPLCSQDASLILRNFPGYKLLTSYDIFQCLACESNFSFPQVEDEKIYDVIYQQGIEHPGYSRYWLYLSQVKLRKKPLKYLGKAESNYFFIEQTLQKVKDKKTLKILEVGSGLGYLTFALNAEGFETIGIDISKSAVNKARDSFGDFFVAEDLFKFKDKEENKFDYVISTETIEHVKDVYKFVEAMFQMVKPGGKLLLTTPNRSFFPLDCVWESSLPPVHLWWLSEKALIFMAEKLGCKYEFFNFRGFHRRNPVILNLENYKRAESYVSILTEDYGLKNVESTSALRKPNLLNLLFLIGAYFVLVRKLLVKILVKKTHHGHVFADTRSTQMGITFLKPF